MIEVASGQPVRAFGVMTGTSMDGVDIAALDTDGETIAGFGPVHAGAFPADLAAPVARAIALIEDVPTADLRTRAHWPDWLHEAERAVTAAIAAEVRAYTAGLGDTDWAQCCSGVHGQTIVHRPDEGFTLQIGARPMGGPGFFDPRMTDIVDFRSPDMVAGGQGAPLAPFYHFALARHIGARRPVAFLNIGGVANVTWVDPRAEAPEAPGALLAFDTGPGNALINDWMLARTGCLTMDLDGGAAAAGRVHADRLHSNRGQAYLGRRPPKSLDRNDFHPVLAAMRGLSINDGAASLTHFTAECVAASLRHMPEPPSRWLVCGGGRLNPVLMAMLERRLGTPVEPVEAVGLDGDMLEAQAFAYLAVRVLRGLPTSAPGTTGCRAPVSGGQVHFGAEPAPETPVSVP